MVGIEQINSGRVLPLNEWDFQRPHKPGRRHPEVVTYHDQTLHSTAITLPQRLNEFAIFIVGPGMQPLFELIEHNHDLRFRRTALAESQRNQCFFERHLVG